MGDDLWQRFLRAEKEMEEELRDVVTEVCRPFAPVRSANRENEEITDSNCIRPMPWRLIGAPSSSSPPTRLPPTQSFASA